MQRAVDDKKHQARLERKPRLTKSDRKRLFEIAEVGDPAEFLDGERCREICSMIELGRAS